MCNRKLSWKKRAVALSPFTSLLPSDSANFTIFYLFFFNGLKILAYLPALVDDASHMSEIATDISISLHFSPFFDSIIENIYI